MPDRPRCGTALCALSLSKGTNERFDRLSAHFVPEPAACALSLSKGTNERFDRLSAHTSAGSTGSARSYSAKIAATRSG
jgi:hypothetical protein